jgi:hypothetical protein
VVLGGVAVHLVVDEEVDLVVPNHGSRTTWIHDARGTDRQTRMGGVNHGTKMKKRWREPASG